MTDRPRVWRLAPVIGTVDGVATPVWVLPSDANGLDPTLVVAWDRDRVLPIIEEALGVGSPDAAALFVALAPEIAEGVHDLT